MARSFTILPTGDYQQLLEKARKIASENGVLFEGNERTGSFSGGGVEGMYKMNGELVVTITDKPFWAPWSLVEDRIREFFI